MPSFDPIVTGYVGLFLNAFLAATMLPAMSEVAVVAMARSERFDPATVWLVATTANTLGSCVNWGLGRFLLQFRDRRWFPFSARQIDRASGWYNRHGLWSLLFAWVPIVGDPLTFIAGALRVRFRAFLLLVGAGKATRYAAALLLAEGVLGSSAGRGAGIAG
jgi:membrane protein YqaA with SNARE-associated domain